MTRDDYWQWLCLICNEPIDINPNARLGESRYMHMEGVIISSHDAVRKPRESE